MKLIATPFIIIIILLISVACQPTLVTPSPSPRPSERPLEAATARPTQTPRQIAAAASPLPTSQNAAVNLSPSTLPPPPLVAAANVASPPLPTVDPALAETSPATRPPASNTFVIGQSTQGQDILAWRFGTGAKTLVIVGGIHSGFEANTVMLVNQLVTHFEATPLDVLPGMTLILVPVANPDGLTQGRQAAGRFNANQVDLNRNWGCEWSAEAYWRDQRVSAGDQPFSEPETLALAQLIRDTPAAAAIFYHSAANGIFEGDCEGRGISSAFAAVLGEATGYPYGRPFSAYPVTGTAASWVDGLGIPAIDLELTGTRETEFTRNLRGIMAAQAWLTQGGL